MNGIKRCIEKIAVKASQNTRQTKLVFIVTGVLSTLWFLIRVIPKPSRATYPCMRTAAPLMSSFIIYLIGITGSAVAFRGAARKFKEARYLLFVLAGLAGSGVLMVMSLHKPDTAFASQGTLLAANEPVGVAKGCVPGRVTWMWDADATNEFADITALDDAYILPKNTNIEKVSDMVDHSVKYLTGSSSIGEAWDKMFRYFNTVHGKCDISYQSGEKVFIKMNIVGQWGLDSTSYDIARGNYKAGHTTPQSVMAILRQLTEEVGVAQQDISLGDPIQQFPKQYYDIMVADYPLVKYISSTGNLGRTLAVPGPDPVMFYSDRGSILREGDPDSWVNSDMGNPVSEDGLYTVINEADYMINVANLKAHERAGVSLCAKNHFGSHGRPFAKQLHMGLVHPDQMPNEISRDDYGKYRVLVDIMGHKNLGGNTILFVLDALYSADGAGNKVLKSKSFGNDWMSSIFMSQDHVAIEAVGLDFAREEYQEKNHDRTYPQYSAIEDYLLQAADPSYWPEGINYDPENDGTPLESLGVYESWNNPVDKEYSGNLQTADGIELIKVHEELATVHIAETMALEGGMKAYPNPFTQSLTLSWFMPVSADIHYTLYSISGQELSRFSIFVDKGDARLNLEEEDPVLAGLTDGSYVVQILYQKEGVRQQASLVVSKRAK